ncbi:hypothetical protein PCE1_004939 [Barthelona sp. PCE]
MFADELPPIASSCDVLTFCTENNLSDIINDDFCTGKCLKNISKALQCVKHTFSHDNDRGECFNPLGLALCGSFSSNIFLNQHPDFEITIPTTIHHINSFFRNKNFKKHEKKQFIAYYLYGFFHHFTKKCFREFKPTHTFFTIFQFGILSFFESFILLHFTQCDVAQICSFFSQNNYNTVRRIYEIFDIFSDFNTSILKVSLKKQDPNINLWLLHFSQSFLSPKHPIFNLLSKNTFKNTTHKMLIEILLKASAYPNFFSIFNMNSFYFLSPFVNRKFRLPMIDNKSSSPTEFIVDELLRSLNNTNNETTFIVDNPLFEICRDYVRDLVIGAFHSSTDVSDDLKSIRDLMTPLLDDVGLEKMDRLIVEYLNLNKQDSHIILTEALWFPTPHAAEPKITIENLQCLTQYQVNAFDPDSYDSAGSVRPLWLSDSSDLVRFDIDIDLSEFYMDNISTCVSTLELALIETVLNSESKQIKWEETRGIFPNVDVPILIGALNHLGEKGVFSRWESSFFIGKDDSFTPYVPSIVPEQEIRAKRLLKNILGSFKERVTNQLYRMVNTSVSGYFKTRDEFVFFLKGLENEGFLIFNDNGSISLIK